MRTLVIALAATTLLLGGGQAALAAPQSNIVGAATPRSAADRQFLRDSHYDDETAAVQDAAIKLARTQCDYLTAVGNSPAEHIYLAESASETIEFPYLFVYAAVAAYCPEHRA
ncbi:DUF732 domain-containing protein [Nocardia harenae]|uniref:DUF732 domain-containing protein n=1 Tax=Nocardia harenae TaxID=358707 RepID=UPI000832A5BD|nr:DUF732 domain-containing protein [Nocardia harenae]